VAHTTRYTVDDLLTLPVREGTRYEVIDGVLYVSTAPNLLHQFAAASATTALGVWSRQTGIGYTFVAPGIIFTVADGVQPDVVWVSAARLQRLRHPDGKLYGPPELVIEVLSPGADNADRDRRAKFQLYGQGGVDEYWLIDWQQHVVEVFRRDDGQLRLTAQWRDGDTITSPLLPGFALPVTELWLPEPAAESAREPA